MYEDIRGKWRQEAARRDAVQLVAKISDVLVVAEHLKSLKHYADIEDYLKTVPWCWQPMIAGAVEEARYLLPVDAWSALRQVADTVRTVHSNRARFADVAREVRDASQFDPRGDKSLGWRCWVWQDKKLLSPVMLAEWDSAELRVGCWHEVKTIVGVEGIHALRMPRNWKKADPWASKLPTWASKLPTVSYFDTTVHGVVERFGKYELGTQGWRAEWAVIKELMVFDNTIGFELENRFPEVRVFYPDEDVRHYLETKYRRK